jgi:hypothetical protein
MEITKEEMARSFQEEPQKSSALQRVGEASYIDKLHPTIRIRVQGQSTKIFTNKQ